MFYITDGINVKSLNVIGGSNIAFVDDELFTVVVVGALTVLSNESHIFALLSSSFNGIDETGAYWISINGAPTSTSYILQEDGFKIILEDDNGFILTQR